MRVGGAQRNGPFLCRSISDAALANKLGCGFFGPESNKGQNNSSLWKRESSWHWEICCWWLLTHTIPCAGPGHCLGHYWSVYQNYSKDCANCMGNNMPKPRPVPCLYSLSEIIVASFPPFGNISASRHALQMSYKGATGRQPQFLDATQIKRLILS